MVLTRRHWLLLLAISSTTVLGAPTAPPACSRTCLDSTSNNIPRGSCTAGDTACLCLSNPYTLQVTQCIVSTCRNATDSDVALSYFTDVCTEVITAATASRTTTITRFITSTQTLATNALTRSTSLPAAIITTSISSPTPLQMTTQPPIPPVLLPTTGSPALSTNVSSNVVTGDSTDQGNNQQSNAMIGGVVGVAALIAILTIILLVVYRRRNNTKKAEEEAGQHSRFIGEEVGSPSAAVHPWRATMLGFTSFAHPSTIGYQAKDSRVTEELPKYEGSGPIRPEKCAPQNGGSSLSLLPAPPEKLLSKPRQPGPWYHQELSRPADEYHDIGSHFLRG